MTTLLDSVNPPVKSVGADPAKGKPWQARYRLHGSEVNTLGGRSMDVSVETVDLGPLLFLQLTAAQRTTVKATLELKATLYLQLPDDGATVFTGYVPDWVFTPMILGDGTLVYDLEFVFKAGLAP